MKWNPFSGPLIDDVETKHYKIMPLLSYYQRNIPSITPILVRQLLPDEGFLVDERPASFFLLDASFTR